MADGLGAGFSGLTRGLTRGLQLAGAVSQLRMNKERLGVLRQQADLEREKFKTEQERARQLQEIFGELESQFSTGEYFANPAPVFKNMIRASIISNDMATASKLVDSFTDIITKKVQLTAGLGARAVEMNDIPLLERTINAYYELLGTGTRVAVSEAKNGYNLTAFDAEGNPLQRSFVSRDNMRAAMLTGVKNPQQIAESIAKVYNLPFDIAKNRLELQRGAAELRDMEVSARRAIDEERRKQLDFALTQGFGKDVLVAEDGLAPVARVTAYTLAAHNPQVDPSTIVSAVTAMARADDDSALPQNIVLQRAPAAQGGDAYILTVGNAPLVVPPTLLDSLRSLGIREPVKPAPQKPSGRVLARDRAGGDQTGVVVPLTPRTSSPSETVTLAKGISAKPVADLTADDVVKILNIRNFITRAYVRPRIEAMLEGRGGDGTLIVDMRPKKPRVYLRIGNEVFRVTPAVAATLKARGVPVEYRTPAKRSPRGKAAASRRALNVGP